MSLLDDRSGADASPYAGSGVTVTLSANQLSAIGVLGVERSQGARVIVPFDVDFTGANNQTIIDLTLHQASFQFTEPRTLFFDNSANPSVVIVTVGQTEQEFPIPANAAGYFPLAAQNNSRIAFNSVGGATGLCSGQLYNYNVPPQVWYEAGIPVVITGATPVIVENTPAQPVPTTVQNTVATTVADGANSTLGARADPIGVAPISQAASVVSLLKAIWNALLNATVTIRGSTIIASLANTITTGGTAVLIVQGPALGVLIQNPVSASTQGLTTAENLYVNIVNATPPSTDAAAFGSNYVLQPGDSMVLPSIASNIGIRVNAASSGHRFSANSW
jgi:hypothetical protein